MKKITYYFSIISCVLLFTVSLVGVAMGQGNYETVVYDSTIEFNAVLKDTGNVEASWSKYNKSYSFSTYKLVRSSVNSNPIYPDNGYIYDSSDINSLSYVDNNAPAGLNYYRICQTAATKRFCSAKVVVINNPAIFYCTNTYNPVCGIDNRTYANSCHAKGNSVTNYTNGRCLFQSIVLSKPLNQMDRNELLRTLVVILVASIKR